MSSSKSPVTVRMESESSSRTKKPSSNTIYSEKRNQRPNMKHQNEKKEEDKEEETEKTPHHNITVDLQEVRPEYKNIH